MRKIVALLLSLMLMGIGSNDVAAQNYSFSKRFFFKLGKYDIDESLRDNRNTVDSILITLRDLKRANASDIRLHITSYASLESSDAYNAKLTFNRTQALTNFLRKFTLVDDSIFVAEENIFDWQRLIELTEASDCPNKAEALNIMRNVPSMPTAEGNQRKDMLQKLGGGTTYEYMRQRFFPEMRNSKLSLTATVPENIDIRVDTITDTIIIDNTIEYEPIRTTEWVFPRRGVIGIRTNGLYDLAAIPNIGIEAYATDNISVGVNWMYAWWKTDKTHKYWRTYGGDIHADYWFDTTKHLWSGHHVGVYGQMVTYDFEWKGKGYQGPKWSWGGGLSYGYAMWLTRHFSLDFGIDVGYLRGKYYEYEPSSKKSIYYWTSTKMRNWIGPTKAEVSLIWKIGNEKTK